MDNHQNVRTVAGQVERLEEEAGLALEAAAESISKLEAVTTALIELEAKARQSAESELRRYIQQERTHRIEHYQQVNETLHNFTSRTFRARLRWLFTGR